MPAVLRYPVTLVSFQAPLLAPQRHLIGHLQNRTLDCDGLLDWFSRGLLMFLIINVNGASNAVETMKSCLKRWPWHRGSSPQWPLACRLKTKLKATCSTWASTGLSVSSSLVSVARWSRAPPTCNAAQSVLLLEYCCSSMTGRYSWTRLAFPKPSSALCTACQMPSWNVKPSWWIWFGLRNPQRAIWTS